MAKRRPRKQSYRDYPLPASMKEPKTKGKCRWCGQAILRPDGQVNLRTWWHPECVKAYLITRPSDQRKLVQKRDKGICSLCKIDTVAEQKKFILGGVRELRGVRVRNLYDTRRAVAEGWPKRYRKTWWDMDHIRPLGEASADDLSYWSLSNLRTLCYRCHQVKTKEDTKRIKAKKRQLMKL